MSERQVEAKDLVESLEKLKESLHQRRTTYAAHIRNEVGKLDFCDGEKALWIVIMDTINRLQNVQRAKVTRMSAYLESMREETRDVITQVEYVEHHIRNPNEAKKINKRRVRSVEL